MQKNINFSSFNPLYDIVELSRLQFSPARLNIIAMQNFLNSPLSPASMNPMFDFTRASLDVAERITRRYDRPEYNVNTCKVDGKEYQIEQVIENRKPFCNLMHFSKKGFTKKLPKLLIVAPLAGHFPTLLRGTVTDCLGYFDVYITDWIDASDVPVIYGKFDLDDYIDYLIEFFQFMEESVNVMAVCQPTVPVLAAISIMSNQKIGPLPKSMILMGGPIDARKNPTELNDFAVEKDLEWFENCVITTVPKNYPGAGRKVYPGFVQLAGFMGLNWQRHLEAHVELFNNLLLHEDNKVVVHKKFYDEYFSMMDLPAEFYLQTIREVFQKFSLAKGELISRGRSANVENITETALLGIEGENDDIASVGQTKAALNLCKNIPSDKKSYYLQKGVGHYGVFTGSKFREQILPVIVEFVKKIN